MKNWAEFVMRVIEGDPRVKTIYLPALITAFIMIRPLIMIILTLISLGSALLQGLINIYDKKQSIIK